MRGVVDDPDLLAMSGVAPARCSSCPGRSAPRWPRSPASCSPRMVNLDILTLTLLVINGYAAAMIGRLKSLPLTFRGRPGARPRRSPTSPATAQRADFSELAAGHPDGHPLRGARLSCRRPGCGAEQRRGGSRADGPLGACAARLGRGAARARRRAARSCLSDANLLIGGRTFVLAIMLLSLVLLTGYGGQVSLCQFTFVGLGAYAMGKLGDGGSLLGVVAAVLLAALFGALVALPALRLRGLYLALATLAFATAMDKVFFQRRLGVGRQPPGRRGVDLPLRRHDRRPRFFVLTRRRRSSR